MHAAQVVESRARDVESEEGGAVWVSVLTLVDLAGSERIAKTGNGLPQCCYGAACRTCGFGPQMAVRITCHTHDRLDPLL